MLAVLLLAGGSTVSTDALVARAWGDSTTDNHHAAVHVTVSRLRKRLGPAVLLTRPPGYQLDVDPGSVDAVRFGQLLAAARLSAADGATERARDEVAQALGLWRGEPYEDVRPEVVAVEVARLRDQRLAAVELSAQLDLATGRHAGLTTSLLPWISAHPLREGLRSSHITALYRSGRQAEALAAVEDLRRTLLDELGVDLSPQLQELHGLILRQDPAATGPVAPSVIGMRPPPIVVGRERELRALEEAVTATRGGGRPVILVTGAAGIGKTTLAVDLAARAERESLLVARGAAVHQDGSAAYWPWAQVLADLQASTPTEVWRRAVDGRGAAAGVLLPNGGLEPPADAPVLLDAVATVLHRIAGSRPTVLVLEDLHWADPDTITLTEHVLATLRAPSLGIVLTAREPTADPAPLRRLRAALGRCEGAVALPLEGLGQAEVGELARLVRAEAISDEAAARLHARTDGNPFFVTELARLLDRERGTGGRTDIPVPPSISSTIEHRLRHLDPAVRSVLDAAAVVGRTAPTQLLASVLDEDAARVQRWLDTATGLGLLEPGPGAGSSTFVHALVQEVLEAALDGGVRRDLHARVAHAVERAAGDHVGPVAGVLAGHHAAAGPAGDPARAVRFALLAADDARRRSARAEEEAELRRAEDVLAAARGAVPDDLRRAVADRVRASTGAADQLAIDERGSNLPAAVSSFIGRDAQLTTVGALVAEHRLVTLTGVGGVGKTRLAVEVARNHETSDGPWLVELAGVRETGVLAQVIAAAVGSAPVGSIDALTVALRGRDLLLVLDNCEHLVAEAAEVVDGLLARCPGVRVLATSREPLLADGENTYDVPPLRAEGEGDALFLARARAAVPAWEPTAADRADIAELCRALDGLPLAIELAAGQVRALSPTEMTGMLDDRFSLLRGGRRGEARHATMRAAVQWSFDLLSERERTALAELSVFAGGFTIDSARTVLDEPAVASLISDLVNKSLVVPGPTGAPRRFRLLETLRQFAAEHLSIDRERELSARLVSWVAGMVSTAAAKGRLAEVQTDQLEAESDNIRAALHGGNPAAVVQLAVGFSWFWFREGLAAEGIGYLEPALRALDADAEAAAEVGPTTIARAWAGLSMLRWLSGDLPGALEAGRCGLAAADLTDLALVRARARVVVCFYSCRIDPAAARALHAEALHLVQEDGDPAAHAGVLMAGAEIERQAGDVDASLATLDVALPAGEEAGYAWVGIRGRWIQAMALLARGDLPGAWAAALESAHRSHEQAETTSFLAALAALAQIGHAAGEHGIAESLEAVVVQRGRRTGFVPAAMDPDLGTLRTPPGHRPVSARGAPHPDAAPADLLAWLDQNPIERSAPT